MDVPGREAAAFLERTTVRELLDIHAGVIDQARRIAHQLYRAGRLAEADVVCRGLIACDHRFAWTYSLHAAVLRRQGRWEGALAQVERGLAFEPGHPKLRAMRDDLLVPRRAPATAPRAPAAAGHGPGAQRAGVATDSDP